MNLDPKELKALAAGLLALNAEARAQGKTTQVLPAEGLEAALRADIAADDPTLRKLLAFIRAYFAAAPAMSHYQGQRAGLIQDAARELADMPPAGWQPIASAESAKEIAVEHKLDGLTIRHSYPIWVRCSGGQPFEVVWSDQGYWWDLAGESPCDPDEWMPYPLTPMPLPAPPAGEGV